MAGSEHRSPEPLLTDRIPPHNIEAEQSVLGSMMLEKDALKRGLELLMPEDFYRMPHEEIFATLGQMAQKDEPVDLITLQEALRERGKLEDCGGTEYLMALVDTVPTAARVEYYANIVAKYAERRRAIAKASAAVHVLFEEDVERPAEYVINQLQGVRTAEVASVESWSLQEMLTADVTPPEFIIEGLVPRRGVSIMTAAPGSGKSFLNIDMGLAVCAGGKFLQHFETVKGPVLLVDLENDQPNMMKRIQQVYASRIETEDLPPDSPMEMVKREERLDLRVDMPASRAALIKRIEAVKPVLVIIDPLVAVHGQEENDNVAMRNQVFRPLKMIAEKFNCAIVVIHHPRKRGQINDDNEMVRGASDILGAVDSHISIKPIDETRRFVSHVKSRFCKEVPKFTYEMMDGAECQTYLRFLGDASETTEKEAQAREVIIEIAKTAGGRVKTSEFKARCEQEGISVTTVERTLKTLVKEKNLKKDGRGWYTWWKEVAGLYDGNEED